MIPAFFGTPVVKCYSPKIEIRNLPPGYTCGKQKSLKASLIITCISNYTILRSVVQNQARLSSTLSEFLYSSQWPTLNDL